MKKIVILVTCILLITVSFSAGCIFEEEKKKSGGNEPVPDNTEALNITAIYHEPASPTANDTVTVYVKIQAENELEAVSIIFCYEDGVCTTSGVMSLKPSNLRQGTEDTYEYSIDISDYFKQEDKITYHVTARDMEGNEVEAEGKFTVQ